MQPSSQLGLSDAQVHDSMTCLLPLLRVSAAGPAVSEPRHAQGKPKLRTPYQDREPHQSVKPCTFRIPRR